ncbi:MAG: CBS domain-containing protein [Parvularculaceae bacterium]|nr:CBS domain-containing protein [Caulobacterales bacterium]HRX40797.1 CBS domain-containing protein [Parvularculaceae bacterium]
MKVELILRTKGSDVFSVMETETVAEAVELLTSKNIGAVIVRNEAGGIAGILSERDIVRRLKAEGAGALSARVGVCMTRNPHTCTPDHTIDDLMSMMTERRIRHIPVVAGGRLIGLVSIGDVVKRKIEMSEQEAAALKEYIAS